MNNIRRFSFLLAIIFTFVFVFPVFAVADENSEPIADNPGINSGNAVVAYCIDDNQFLYTNRIDELVAPTVAAKLVACMVVSDILAERGISAESVDVTVSSTAIANSGDIADVRVPMMGFKVGDTYNAKDLISCTLVACANDAVASLASHFGEVFLGGNITDFVNRMNQKVADLGLTNTNFVNPTGLEAANQYTTPREVALIAAAFYQYNDLVSLSNVESFLFNNSTTVRSKNFLKSGYYVSGYTNKEAIGLIAGQLNREGNYCLITASQKDGRTYIFVVMCASGMIVTPVEDRYAYSFGIGNAYDDMNKLISWTRESFSLLTIATTTTIIGELRVNLGSSADHVMIVPAEDIERLVITASGGQLTSTLTYDESLVYKKEFNGSQYDTINAPVSQGQRVGSITYYYNGQELATVDAVIKDSIESDSVKQTLDTAKNFLFGDLMKTILIVIGGLIGAYIIVTIVIGIVRIVKKVNNGKSPKQSNKKSAKPPKGNSNSDKNNPNNSTREMR